MAYTSPRYRDRPRMDVKRELVYRQKRPTHEHIPLLTTELGFDNMQHIHRMQAKKKKGPCGLADELLLATMLSLDDMQHVHGIRANLRQAHLDARGMSKET